MSLRVWYAGMCPPSAAPRRRKRKRRGFCVFPSFLHPDWFTLSPTAHERRPGNSTETFVFLPDVFTRASCVTLPCCPRVWSGLAGACPAGPCEHVSLSVAAVALSALHCSSGDVHPLTSASPLWHFSLFHREEGSWDVPLCPRPLLTLFTQV